jgi:hypothetical protein
LLLCALRYILVLQARACAAAGQTCACNSCGLLQVFNGCDS